MMKEGRGVVAGNTVIALENDTGIGTAKGKGAVKEKAKGFIAVVEDTAATAKIATETEGESVTTMRNRRLETAIREKNLTRMSTTLVTALAQPTETVLPIEGLEVGLLSIHETNSMIHPGIEEITVVERAGTLLRMRMNTGNAVSKQEVLRPLLLGTWFDTAGQSFAYLFVRRLSPSYETGEDYNPDEPKEDDSEARSVFVSQLAARLTARDLGYFFEDKLGEGAVMDARIVTDRLSRRSKGLVFQCCITMMV